jgi:hypothetical protein
VTHLFVPSVTLTMALVFLREFVNAILGGLERLATSQDVITSLIAILRTVFASLLITVNVLLVGLVLTVPSPFALKLATLDLVTNA